MMGYAKDWYKLRTGEVLTNVFLQSKLVEAEKIIGQAMSTRKDIAGILTRINSLKKKARSSNKTGKEIDSLEKNIMSFIKDESSRVFSMVESNMILLHEMVEYLHEIIKVNHEISKEKVAQSNLKLKIPDISNPKQAKKAQKKIESMKKKVESATEEGQKLVEIKQAAAQNMKEIKVLIKELKKEMVKFRNQFDSMRRFELR